MDMFWQICMELLTKILIEMIKNAKLEFKEQKLVDLQVASFIKSNRCYIFSFLCMYESTDSIH